MKKVEKNLWEDFEVFTSKGAKIKNPKITITQNSTFLFNAAFIHTAKIQDKTHLLLGYSPSNNKITFDFTADQKAEGALTIVHRVGAASVGSRSFFNYFFLDSKNLAGSYVPKKIKIPKVGEVWTIDLGSKLALK
jgi:hypothetical protein